MDQLSDELVEAQKVRSDLLKWKIGLISGLGAVGFGLAGKGAQTTYADLVLCCIPFVCAYVDILCRHLSLRIYVIGQFHKKDRGKADKSVEGEDLRIYEDFVDKVRKKGAFALENGAVFLSSVILCLSLIYMPETLKNLYQVPLQHNTIIQKSGCFGLLVVSLIEIVFWILKARVKQTKIKTE